MPPSMPLSALSGFLVWKALTKGVHKWGPIGAYPSTLSALNRPR